MDRISNWQDLQFFIAAYNHLSLSKAARAIGVSHVTVGRRLAALEESIGSPLFERSALGIVPTALAESLIQRARTVQDNVAAFDRLARSATQSNKSPVRIAVPTLLSSSLLVECLAAFQKSTLNFGVEVLEGSRVVNLSRREADIGLRVMLPGSVPGSDVTLARRVCELDWSLYAHPDFAKRYNLHFPVDSLEGIPVLRYSDSAPAPIDRRWFHAHQSNLHVAFLANSAQAVLSAIHNQMGAGIIPSYFGERSGLIRLSDTAAVTWVWLVVHPDLRNAPRVRALYDFVADYFSSLLPDTLHPPSSDPPPISIECVVG